jgi:tetratricopeptide (TPR) repeat protein
MTIASLILSLVLALVPLQSKYSIIGSVRDSEGNQPTATLRVTLLDENYGSLRTLFVDNSGRFQFRNLGPGIYFVRIETGGTPYEEETQRIQLDSLSPRRSTTEEPYSVDFRLRRKRGQVSQVVPGVIFVQEVPAAARAEYERAQANFKDQKLKLGIEALKKAIEIFPEYFVALELLGTEYVKFGDYDNALPILARAIQVNPDAPKSLYALGVAHLKSNRSAEALAWLHRAADKDPKNPNVYMMMGLAYGYIDSLSESEVYFKKAYALGGGQSDVANVHFYLASIYNRQRKYADAVRELELFLKEATDVNDKAQVRELIQKLKAKSTRPVTN